MTAAPKRIVARSHIAPCMPYGMELRRPAKNCANVTAMLNRATKLTSGIRRDASHTAFFMHRSVNQDVILADLDIS